MPPTAARAPALRVRRSRPTSGFVTRTLIPFGNDVAGQSETSTPPEPAGRAISSEATPGGRQPAIDGLRSRRRTEQQGSLARPTPSVLRRSIPAATHGSKDASGLLPVPKRAPLVSASLHPQLSRLEEAAPGRREGRPALRAPFHPAYAQRMDVRALPPAVNWPLRLRGRNSINVGHEKPRPPDSRALQIREIQSSNQTGPDAPYPRRNARRSCSTRAMPSSASSIALRLAASVTCV